MKTVYKKIVVTITALFVISLSFLPFSKTARAANINEPQPNAEYIFTKIGISEKVQFAVFGASTSPAYVFDGLNFNIYNTTTFSTGGAFTYDSINTAINDTGGRGNINLVNTTATKISGIYTFYLPPIGSAVTSAKRYMQFPLYNFLEYSSTLSGQITSYTIGPYKSANVDHNDGFYVKFNFEVGFKKYYFYDSAHTIMSPSKDVTSVIQVASADTIGSFNQGKQEGYNNGYYDGYNDGKTDGERTGYNTGYTAGYQEGRVAPAYSFKEFFIGLGDAFVTIYTSMLSYEFLGVNIAGLIGTVVVIITILIVVKLILKK